MKNNLGIKNLIAVIFILLLINQSWSLPAEEYDLPIKSIGNIEFHLDVCQYEGLSGGSRIEFIYSVDLSQFSGGTDSTHQTAVFDILFLVHDSNRDTLIHSIERKHIHPGNNSQNTFFDLKQVESRTDSIMLVFSIQNSLSNKKGIIEKYFERKGFPDHLSISDLYFISHIQKAKSKNVFEKNGLLMIPNPSRNFSYSEQTPNAYVYFEINHLLFAPENPLSYSVSYKIENISGNEVASHQRPTIPKTSSNCSRVEIIPLADLKPGIYKLTLHVTDLQSRESATNWRYFSISSSEDAPDMLLSMTEDNIKKYFDQIKYIATAEEKELFKKLTLRGKQEFLINFWQSKDPNPETAENEFMPEHFKRMAYAAVSFTGGIDSDMGRIYIQYGTPVEIERQFSTTEFNKPVQIWYYAIQGRTEFVFVDRSGDGKYVLVHSTHPDEYQNPNWINDIK